MWERKAWASSAGPAVTITKRQTSVGTQLSHKNDGITHSLNRYVLSAYCALEL